MTPTPTIKPGHKAIQAYYESLQSYAGQGVGHETAVRSAFQNLLAETAKLSKWTLVPELSLKVKGHLIRPDATLIDDREHLPILLTRLYAPAERDIKGFERAVTEFQQRIPSAEYRH